MRKKIAKPDTSGFSLGQWVEFSHTVVRRSDYTGSGPGWRKEWVREPFREAKFEPAGIVVGIRHLSNGRNRFIGEDGPLVYEHQDYLVAILIAYDIHRKPVLALPGDVKPRA